MTDDWQLATRAVTAGRPVGPGTPYNVPPTLASTYREGGEIGYGRWGNPTWSAFEEALGSLEGGRAVAFSSGLAAVSAILDTLPLGAKVLMSGDAYTGTRALIAELADRERVVVVEADLTSAEQVAASLDDVALVWVETPTNPLLNLVDVRAVAGLASAARIPLIVDNTMASPVLQHPLGLGATAVVHSATKFIGGHADLLLGVVLVQDEDRLSALVEHRTLHGATPGTLETWLALRGLRTLPLRMDRAQASAQVLARGLVEHSAVRRVHYPGLTEHRQHHLVGPQMTGPGAIVSFEVADAETADAVCQRLRLVVSGTSFGGVETTIDRRSRWAGEERVPTGLLRLSVGIEDVEDLWHDLSSALKAVMA